MVLPETILLRSNSIAQRENYHAVFQKKNHFRGKKSVDIFTHLSDFNAVNCNPFITVIVREIMDAALAEKWCQNHGRRRVSHIRLSTVTVFEHSVY